MSYTEELDKFLDKLMVVFEEDQRPSVADLSNLMTKSRQEFLGSCLQHMIEQRYSAEPSAEESSCPRSDMICTHRQVVRKKLQTAQGPLELRRPGFYTCRVCKEGFAPLDVAAEISLLEKSGSMQKKSAVGLPAQLPSSAASEDFRGLTGLMARDHFISRSLHEVGGMPRFRRSCRRQERLKDE